MPQAEPLMLRDKVVVVTGGAGLLGRAFCAAIAARGGVAIVADIDSDRAEQVAGEIRSSDGNAFASRLDITDCSSVDGLIADVQRRHGRLDAVVNNAYPRHANYGRRLEDVTYADFSASVAAHLGGYFLVSQRFAAHAAAHGGGTIVNIASIYGVLAPRFDLYEGLPMTMPVEYAAIKAAVIQLTRYFAQYFKQDAVRCNAVAPGGIRDGQPELFVRRYEAYCGTKGMLDPADVEGAVVFLLSDASRAITGQVLTVDDGFTL